MMLPSRGLSDVASPFQAMRTGRKPGATLRTNKVIIRPGVIHDYDALARFHYRAGRPATHVRVLVLELPASPDPIGVLVVSMPTLNGRWRDLAWPGRYRTHDRRADTQRLNRELRTISRVIIDPRYRGLGYARALVRAYLADPLTPTTEAVAAMAACSPFFAHAGMTQYTLAPHKREQQLAAALEQLNTSPLALLRTLSPWERVPPKAGGEGPNPALTHALHVWANASRTTRHLRCAPPHALARAAAMALLSPTIAFAHGLTPVQAPLDCTRGPDAHLRRVRSTADDHSR